MTIGFVVGFSGKRYSTGGPHDHKINHYVNEVTLNKSIEVFESKLSSCVRCFRIKISTLPNIITKEQTQNNMSSELTTETSTPLLVLGTAGAATFFASKN